MSNTASPVLSVLLFGPVHDVVHDLAGRCVTNTTPQLGGVRLSPLCDDPKADTKPQKDVHQPLHATDLLRAEAQTQNCQKTGPLQRFGKDVSLFI